jgi:SAM-dependent methyltransferase
MISSKNWLSDHNAEIFDNSKVAAWYGSQGLCPAEQVFLKEFRTAYIARRVLDLGVGSGRTTRHLAPAASSYVGIDRSPAMLNQARRANPFVDFRQMDVRAIDSFGPGSFDFVFGSSAIVSAFAHQDRLDILAAVHGILAADGLFIFSFHNRAWQWAGRGPLPPRDKGISALFDSLHPKSWYNYLRLRRYAYAAADHAMWVDQAHRWSGLFYFTDLATQVAQAGGVGFEVEAIYGQDGRPVARTDDLAADGLLHLVCRRGA